MALTDLVLMPGTDYRAICDATRALTGGTAALKSGDIAGALGGVSGGVLHGTLTPAATGTSITVPVGAACGNLVLRRQTFADLTTQEFLTGWFCATDGCLCGCKTNNAIAVSPLTLAQISARFETAQVTISASAVAYIGNFTAGTVYEWWAWPDEEAET